MGLMMISAGISRTQQTGRSSSKTGSIIYTNRMFGFEFHLPTTWKGFKIVAKTWDGDNDHGQNYQHGPLILIRHPLWTDDDPHEDIPIMVFTLAQWQMIEKETLDVSAAPFPPGELGRNNKYVFATPPRYSYDELDRVEEVIHIINSGALHPIPPSSAH
jgi:hypothetical protein